MRVALLAVLVSAAAAQAEEACLFEAHALKPQFAARLPKGFKLKSTKKVKRELTQVLSTPEGFQVTLTLGGCEHVRYGFALKGPGLTSKTAGAEVVALSKRVLGSLPMREDATADAARFVRALDEARIASLPADLPCGDATCTLALGEDPVKKPKKPVKKGKGKEEPAPAAEPPGVVTLTYDLAL